MLTQYRSDIEGLRAVAVLLVLVFHISPASLSAGYVGVDVFFVISGFLITCIVKRSIQCGSFSLKLFYIKRLRRLFPVYIAVLAFSTILMYSIGLPIEIRAFGESALSSIWYVSNIYFFSQNSYFDTALQSNMLLHTWSLSVEEQFYLVYPAFLLFGYKYFKSCVFYFYSLFLLFFFGVFVYVVGSFETAAFYLTPFRFWQFMLGGVIAFLPAGIQVRKWCLEWLSVLGLLLILFSSYYYHGHNGLFGLDVLLPTVGAFLIILAGTYHNTLVSQLLSYRVATLIGKISYSLYLWHWPIIVWYKLKISFYPSLTDKIFLFVVCLITGACSWYLLEKSTRDIAIRRKNVKYIFLAILCMLLLSIVSVVFISTQGTATRFPPKVLNYQNYLDYDFESEARDGRCFLSSQFNSIKSFDFEGCIRTEPEQKNILLIGDSHAAHYYSALVSTFHGSNVSQVNASGCRPIFDPNGDSGCELLFDYVIREYVSRGVFDIVVLAGRWKAYEYRRYMETVDVLLESGSLVYFIGPTIEYRKPVPRILVDHGSVSLDFLETARLTNYAKAKRVEKRMFSDITSLSEGRENVELISVLDVFCSSRGCEMADENGIPFQFDYGHLTKYGAQVVINRYFD